MQQDARVLDLARDGISLGREKIPFGLRIDQQIDRSSKPAQRRHGVLVALVMRFVGFWNHHHHVIVALRPSLARRMRSEQVDRAWIERRAQAIDKVLDSWILLRTDHGHIVSLMKSVAQPSRSRWRS